MAGSAKMRFSYPFGQPRTVEEHRPVKPLRTPRPQRGLEIEMGELVRTMAPDRMEATLKPLGE